MSLPPQRGQRNLTLRLQTPPSRINAPTQLVDPNRVSYRGSPALARRHFEFSCELRAEVTWHRPEAERGAGILIATRGEFSSTVELCAGLPLPVGTAYLSFEGNDGVRWTKTLQVEAP